MSDLISREDAIRESVWLGVNGNYYEVVSVDDLKKLPSAERIGKWVNHRNDDGHNIADCSLCGSTLQWFDNDGEHNYCPNCGAIMDSCENASEITRKSNASDLIKRDDALTAVGEAIFDGRSWYDALVYVPSVEQWIPCSERLPIKDDCVFVYLFGDSPYIAWHDGVDWCTNDFTVDKDEEPLAWMPLPKPYEGGTE